jgi:hypothetical protein
LYCSIFYPYLDLAAPRPFPEEMGDAEDQATLASPLDLFAEGPKISYIDITEKHRIGHVQPGEI